MVGDIRQGLDCSRPVSPVGQGKAMMERELTGQRDGQAWKSHQINDEKFSGGKSRSRGPCHMVHVSVWILNVHGVANVSASKYACTILVPQGRSGYLEMS